MDEKRISALRDQLIKKAQTLAAQEERPFGDKDMSGIEHILEGIRQGAYPHTLDMLMEQLEQSALATTKTKH